MVPTAAPHDGLSHITLHAGGHAMALGSKPPQGVQPKSLAQQAMRWSYVLRTRERWADNPDARSRHELEALATLQGFGLGDADIQRIARAEQVIVRMPWVKEDTGWAGRIFPWEYVISAATRPMRSRVDARFAVMRELRQATGAAKPVREKIGSGARVLYVQSAPGRLADGWDFDGERRRLARVLEGTAEIRVLKNPMLDTLVAEVAGWKPDILHLSGFDNVQGLAALRELAGPQTLIDVPQLLLPDTGDADRHNLVARSLARLLQDERVLQDGYLMTSPNGRPCVVTALDLAESLGAAGHRPFLASVSVASSAARTAALLVGQGAVSAAVGFQGDFDSSFGDYFFELLYSELLGQSPGLSAAFQRTWATARHQPRARRVTGIALWAAFDLATTGKAVTGAAGLPRKGKGPPTLNARPLAAINYAVLHNTGKGGLFESFVVERNDASAGDMISVEVEVHLGTEKAVYSKCFAVADEDRWNLADEIHVPLTATLVRSVREAVNSSVVVQLAHKGKVLRRESHRVRLLPVDQWRDNGHDGQWLPSFVLPRDAMVMGAVQQAQRYVRVLRDDPTAGFEGYQAAPDEDPPLEEQMTEVDLQAQALWATLLHDWQLGYINPPPAYSAELDSQRLRTPSTVRRNAAGTCIDLALLYAACLELVDIYPVIFLLHGHALPGYWRHSKFHADFNAGTYPGGEDSTVAINTRRATSSDIQKHPWQTLGPDAHKELAWRIRTRQLVPLETVRLTENCGFVEAIEAGVEALSSADDFHSMLDIVRARQAGVTPLPIVEDAA